MKRHILNLGLAAAVCGALSSCSLDDPQNVNTYTFEVLNHITSSNPEEEVLLTPSSYTFRLDGNKNLISFKCENLIFANASHNITTTDIRYSAQGFATPFQSGSIISFNSGSANVSNGGEAVTDLYGQLNSTAYPAGMLQSTPVVSYKLGSDRTIRTVRSDSYFVGESTISDTTGELLKTNDGVYRLVLNPTTKKAQLALAALPLSGLGDDISLIIRDLPITLTEAGYTIEKEEAIAEVSNNPGDHSWVFRNISIKTTEENLTRIQISLDLDDSQDGRELSISAYVSYTLF